MPKIVLEMTKDQKDTIELICRRKRINLAEYVIDNMVEWDDHLACMDDDPSSEVCEGCDYSDRCPDYVKAAETQVAGDLCPYCKKKMHWDQWKEIWICPTHGKFENGVKK